MPKIVVVGMCLPVGGRKSGCSGEAIEEGAPAVDWHPKNCENAKEHKCRCSYCAGTLHRWKGCVKMAREPDSARRDTFRDEVHRKWNVAHKPPPKRRRVKPTKNEKATGTDSAVVDIVDWLAEHPTVTDQVEAIANVLGKEVVNELDRSFDAAHRDARRRDLADHFWCALLAALAQMLHTYQQQLDRIPDHIIGAIIAARGSHGKRSPIDEEDIRRAARQAWTLIKNIPFVKAALPGVDEPLLAIRILAVLICPAPEDHREVAQYCLHPLIGELVGDITKLRLQQVLPDDWMPLTVTTPHQASPGG